MAIGEIIGAILASPELAALVLTAFATVVTALVGWVLADDARGIVLAASINGADAAGVVIIPRRQITKRRALRERKG